MYQIVFTGRLKADARRQDVEASLTRLFRMTPQQVAWLLRGVPVVLKHTPDPALAWRYLKTLEKAGLVCEIKEELSRAAAKAARAAAPAEPAPVQSLLPGLSAEPLAPQAPAPADPVDRNPQPQGPGLPPLPPTAQEAAGSAVPIAEDFTPRPIPAREERLDETAGPPRSRFWTAATLLTAVLIGVACAVLLFERSHPGFVAAKISRVAPAAQVPAVPARTASPAAPRAVSRLLEGHWMCLNNGFNKMGENIFTNDGQFHSLTYGNPDSPVIAGAIDVQIAGSYRIDGNKVYIHITEIPSRALLGRSTRVDEYAIAEIAHLTDDSMSWAFSARGLTETEGCMRALPAYGRGW